MKSLIELLTDEQLDSIGLLPDTPDKYEHLNSDDDIFDQPEDRNDDSAKAEMILDDDLPDYDDAMALDKQIWRAEQNNLNEEN